MAIPRSIRVIVNRLRPPYNAVPPLIQEHPNEKEEDDGGPEDRGDDDETKEDEEESNEADQDVTMEIKLPQEDNGDTVQRTTGSTNITCTSKHSSIGPSSTVHPTAEVKDTMITSPASIVMLPPSSGPPGHSPMPSPSVPVPVPGRPRPFRKSFTLLRLSFGSSSASSSSSVSPSTPAPATLGRSSSASSIVNPAGVPLSSNSSSRGPLPTMEVSSTPALSCCSKEVAEDPFARVSPADYSHASTVFPDFRKSKASSPLRPNFSSRSSSQSALRSLKSGRPSTAPSSPNEIPPRSGWLDAMHFPMPSSPTSSPLAQEKKEALDFSPEKNAAPQPQSTDNISIVSAPMSATAMEESAGRRRFLSMSSKDKGRAYPAPASQSPVSPMAIPGVRIPISASSASTSPSSPISSYGTLPSLSLSSSASSVGSAFSFASNMTDETIVTVTDATGSRHAHRARGQEVKNHRDRRRGSRKNTLEEAFAVLDDLYDSTEKALASAEEFELALSKITTTNNSPLVDVPESASDDRTGISFRHSQVSLLDPMCHFMIGKHSMPPTAASPDSTIAGTAPVEVSSPGEKVKRLRNLPSLREQRLPPPSALSSARPDNVIVHDRGEEVEEELLKILAATDQHHEPDLQSGPSRSSSVKTVDGGVERADSARNSRPAHELSKFIEDLETALEDTTTLAYLHYFGAGVEGPPIGLFDATDWLARRTGNLPVPSQRAPLLCRRAVTSPPTLVNSDASDALHAGQGLLGGARCLSPVPLPLPLPRNAMDLAAQGNAQGLVPDAQSEARVDLPRRPPMPERSRFSFSSAESMPTSRFRPRLRAVKASLRGRPPASAGLNQALSSTETAKAAERWFPEPAPTADATHDLSGFGILRPVRGVFKRQASLPTAAFASSVVKRKVVSDLDG